MLSHSSFYEENIATIKRILGKNNFPPRTIEKLISQVKCSNARNRTAIESSYPFINNTTVASSADTSNANMMMSSSPMANSTLVQTPMEPMKKKAKYAGLTYIPELTENLTRQIKKYAPELGVAPRPPEKSLEIVHGHETEVRARTMFVCGVWNSMWWM